MIGKVVTGCVAILSYHTATQDRGSECRDFGFISRVVTALLSIDIFFKDGVSKFLAQVHMRPKAHPVCLKAQRFVVILSAHK